MLESCMEQFFLTTGHDAGKWALGSGPAGDLPRAGSRDLLYRDAGLLTAVEAEANVLGGVMVVL